MHNKLKGSSGVSGGWGLLCLGFSRKTFVFVDCSLKHIDERETVLKKVRVVSRRL